MNPHLTTSYISKDSVWLRRQNCIIHLLATYVRCYIRVYRRHTLRILIAVSPWCRQSICTWLPIYGKCGLSAILCGCVNICGNVSRASRHCETQSPPSISYMLHNIGNYIIVICYFFLILIQNTSLYNAKSTWTLEIVFLIFRHSTRL